MIISTSIITTSVLHNCLKKRFSIMSLAGLLSFNVMAADEYTVELYETYCVACHASPGADVPVAFKEQDWEKRLNAGLDKVVSNAINGIGNMPAQGFCMECVYEDFEELVRYMSKSKTE